MWEKKRKCQAQVELLQHQNSKTLVMKLKRYIQACNVVNFSISCTSTSGSSKKYWNILLLLHKISVNQRPNRESPRGLNQLKNYCVDKYWLQVETTEENHDSSSSKQVTGVNVLNIPEKCANDNKENNNKNATTRKKKEYIGEKRGRESQE